MLSSGLQPLISPNAPQMIPMTQKQRHLPLYDRPETSTTRLNSRCRSAGSTWVNRTRILSLSIPSIAHFKRSSEETSWGWVRDACSLRMVCSRFRSAHDRMGSMSTTACTRHQKLDKKVRTSHQIGSDNPVLLDLHVERRTFLLYRRELSTESSNARLSLLLLLLLLLQHCPYISTPSTSAFLNSP